MRLGHLISMSVRFKKGEKACSDLGICILLIFFDLISLGSCLL